MPAGRLESSPQLRGAAPSLFPIWAQIRWVADPVIHGLIFNQKNLTVLIGQRISSGAQFLLFSDEGYDLVRGAILSLLRSQQDRPDVETMLGCLRFAGSPNFIDDGVLCHGLIRLEFLRRANHGTLVAVGPAYRNQRLGDYRVGNVHAISGYQEVQTVHSRNRYVGGVAGSLAWNLA